LNNELHPSNNLKVSVWVTVGILRVDQGKRERRALVRKEKESEAERVELIKRRRLGVHSCPAATESERGKLIMKIGWKGIGSKGEKSPFEPRFSCNPNG